ncbi:adenosylcobinamide-phosphate guanylyltransferase; adenosylcobinamide kinase [Chthonomonas calidirosea]|uniref:bifunctional adenosylcobinamide kinase/adenosylcobinamide-phosphate guanylyltransferase n=1 Tax=Chthonomonas calidirosea TaxID=454171 RepID=UPI0006DD3E59|nr:bifunctional adenosylcobinamide kinase/adenosylcobinamide-phosphate guanylyltransferase [Chthonomonas calidirosea]CEK14949.1 adenosylcobinamide-phosphate guanylyltransferase; adenosylcobinamide kinase [Chthonomonas calidirosea]
MSTQLSKARFIFVVGGARSGKSRYAQNLAKTLAEQRLGRVLFIATAEVTDEEMAARIAYHRRERPQEWDTIEVPIGAADAILARKGQYDVILLDCITLFLSNLLLSMQEQPRDQIEIRIRQEVERLCAAARASEADVLFVSNEVGLSLHPLTALGRLFQDIAGRANQIIAAAADEVVLMFCGIPLKIKSQEGSD